MWYVMIAMRSSIILHSLVYEHCVSLPLKQMKFMTEVKTVLGSKVHNKFPDLAQKLVCLSAWPCPP